MACVLTCLPAFHLNERLLSATVRIAIGYDRIPLLSGLKSLT
ncbi:hypothetical protein [Psychrobacter sp. I-STPA10]|nr:hypothetical protein [Psychrobacter sp. I-STPA10]